MITFSIVFFKNAFAQINHIFLINHLSFRLSKFLSTTLTILVVLLSSDTKHFCLPFRTMKCCSVSRRVKLADLLFLKASISTKSCFFLSSYYLLFFTSSFIERHIFSRFFRSFCNFLTLAFFGRTYCGCVFAKVSLFYSSYCNFLVNHNAYFVWLYFFGEKMTFLENYQR